ncbi:hypothetical protein BDZ45DRAFT_264493 [Acephala macrosclerotiorum]|nr:hypothetical protein BDZ45DRAFT_264493 [Acephala macrosclerotiorum]
MNELAIIDEWLVTPENPPREVDGMDHERCIALHNYIIQYAWVASNRHLSDLNPQSWFEKYADEAIEAREYLDPNVILFLEKALILPEPKLYEEALYMFYWVSGLSEPDDLWTNWKDGAEGGEEFRRMTLYAANSLEGHVDGLCYDQKTHKACMFMSFMDQRFTDEDEVEHSGLWHPLETVLSNWISMIRLGKITAGPEGVKLDNEKWTPWMYHSYSPQQVEDTVAAFNRLVVAIESRIPAARRRWPALSPIFSHELLDSALIPRPSFTRSFLMTIRLPSFKFIAPGLLLPTPETFVQSQSFTSTKDDDDNLAIPPVLLFRSQQNFHGDHTGNPKTPFGRPYNSVLQDNQIRAGVYTDPICRRSEDTAEEGFRLVLPFPLALSARPQAIRRKLGESSEIRKIVG